MNARDREALAACEREYLREPEPDFESKTCACCEAVPDDDMLYKLDGAWYCSGCLLYDMLESRYASIRKEWE